MFQGPDRGSSQAWVTLVSGFQKLLSVHKRKMFSGSRPFTALVSQQQLEGFLEPIFIALCFLHTSQFNFKPGPGAIFSRFFGSQKCECLVNV